MPKKLKQFRQGDVFIQEVREIPSGLKAVKRDAGRIVLAYGEVTGHCHAIEDDLASLWTDDLEQRFLAVEAEGVQLVHEEHSTIDLPPGKYRVIIQREYHPEAIRRVAD